MHVKPEVTPTNLEPPRRQPGLAGPPSPSRRRSARLAWRRLPKKWAEMDARIARRLDEALGRAVVKDVARRLRRSRMTLHRWRAGESRPGARDVLVICDLLDLDPAWLAGEHNLSLDQWREAHARPSREESDLLASLRRLPPADRALVEQMIARCAASSRPGDGSPQHDCDDV